MGLQNWSLCLHHEADQTFEVHALTRAWLRTQPLPAPDTYRAIAHRAGEYFRDQPTWEAEAVAMDYFELAESWENYATAAFRLEGHYRLIGLYPAARALTEAVLVKNISPVRNAKAMNSLGVLGLSVGDYETALAYLQQSLAIQQKIGDTSGEGTTLNNISQIYDARGDYETALGYLQQSLAIHQQIGDKSGTAVTSHNMAALYLEQLQEVERAVELFHSAYLLFQQLGSPNAKVTEGYLVKIKKTDWRGAFSGNFAGAAKREMSNHKPNIDHHGPSTD